MAYTYALRDQGGSMCAVLFKRKSNPAICDLITDIFSFGTCQLVFSNFSQIMPLIVYTSCKHFLKSLNCYSFSIFAFDYRR